MTDRFHEHQRHCKHFTGLLQDTCAAGIAYTAFPSGCLPYLPEYNTGGSGCACFEVMTDEEAQAMEATIQEAAAAALTALLSGNCPECGARVEREEQRGRSVYARPCGHRLYQGKVGAFRKSGQ